MTNGRPYDLQNGQCLLFSFADDQWSPIPFCRPVDVCSYRLRTTNGRPYNLQAGQCLLLPFADDQWSPLQFAGRSMFALTVGRPFCGKIFVIHQTFCQNIFRFHHARKYNAKSADIQFNLRIK